MLARLASTPFCQAIVNARLRNMCEVSGGVSGNLGAGTFVAFNGNGTGHRRHGHGYKPVTWLRKAGYLETQASTLLADFHQLAGRFGLTVAAYSSTDHSWKGLDVVRAMTGQAGDRWLAGCVLRVYSTADFLPRWRRYFADRLGFASLPGGEETPAIVSAPGGIRSAIELQVWMTENGHTDGSLAAALGVGRTTVNLYRRGTRNWSPRFEARLAEWLTTAPAGVPDRNARPDVVRRP